MQLKTGIVKYHIVMDKAYGGLFVQMIDCSWWVCNKKLDDRSNASYQGEYMTSYAMMVMKHDTRQS